MRTQLRFMDTNHDIFRAELCGHRGIAVVVGVIEGDILLVTAFFVFVVFVIVVFVALVVFVVFVTIVVFALDLFICGERKTSSVDSPSEECSNMLSLEDGSKSVGSSEVHNDATLPPLADRTARLGLRQKIGKRADCLTGGMLGATMASSLQGPTLLPMESPSSVDAGEASLPSTEWSSAANEDMSHTIFSSTLRFLSRLLITILLYVEYTRPSRRNSLPPPLSLSSSNNGWVDKNDDEDNDDDGAGGGDNDESDGIGVDELSLLSWSSLHSWS